MEDTQLMKKVSDVLAAYPEIQLGVVFGSAVSGTMRADSDVDVAVLGQESLSLSLRLELITELSLAVGREVDVVDLYSAHGVILRQVLTKGIAVLERTKRGRAALMKRMLFDQSDMEPYRRRMTEVRLQRGFNG
ncbi:MAG: nucleotidyltransferase domain-containing protein [Desulfovibrionales bacterium]|nr:nucleotidyltransferase domain-containing protein [Desulfovibrionales bacterium]